MGKDCSNCWKYSSWHATKPCPYEGYSFNSNLLMAPRGKPVNDTWRSLKRSSDHFREKRNRRHASRRWLITGRCAWQLSYTPPWGQGTWEPLLLPSSNHRSHPQDLKHLSSSHPVFSTAEPERIEKNHFQRLDTLRHWKEQRGKWAPQHNF